MAAWSPKHASSCCAIRRTNPAAFVEAQTAFELPVGAPREYAVKSNLHEWECQENCVRVNRDGSTEALRGTRPGCGTCGPYWPVNYSGFESLRAIGAAGCSEIGAADSGERADTLCLISDC